MNTLGLGIGFDILMVSLVLLGVIFPAGYYIAIDLWEWWKELKEMNE